MQRKVAKKTRGENPVMPQRTWRVRLARAIEADGRSLRAIGKVADKMGYGPIGETYVWELLNTKKEPTVSKLLAVCSALNVSASYILEGIQITADNERLWKAFARMSPPQQKSFLEWIEKH